MCRSKRARPASTSPARQASSSSASDRNARRCYHRRSMVDRAFVDTAHDPAEQQMRSRLMGALFGGEAIPVRVGRYVVLDQIGSGGLGVVYSAYDPELDR